MAEQTVSIPHVGKNVEDLLLWRDTKKSGIVFGLISACCLYVLLSGMTLLSLVCYAVTTVAVGAFVWTNFGKYVGIEAPTLPEKLKDGLSDEDWRDITTRAKPHIDMLTANSYRLLSGKEINVTVAVAGISFVAGRVFAAVNILLVSYLVVVCAFVLPKAYEMNKEKVDKEILPKVKEVWDSAYAKLDEMVLKKIPRASTAVSKKED